MFLFYISAMMLKTLEFYLENVHKKKVHTKCKDIFVKIKKLVWAEVNKNEIPCFILT